MGKPTENILLKAEIYNKVAEIENLKLQIDIGLVTDIEDVLLFTKEMEKRFNELMQLQKRLRETEEAKADIENRYGFSIRTRNVIKYILEIMDEDPLPAIKIMLQSNPRLLSDTRGIGKKTRLEIIEAIK